MRDAMKRLGGDPTKINPLVPVDLVIDHSVQVDYARSADAAERNQEREFQRNGERFVFLKWGQGAFANTLIVPPASGIVHQVNLEYLARGVFAGTDGDKLLCAPLLARHTPLSAHEVFVVVRVVLCDCSSPLILHFVSLMLAHRYPDSVVGTDSHTTMINGLGIVGWGVGGIEAEAVMLGQSVSMVLPEVVGYKLTGTLPSTTTSTDLVLTITEALRKFGVVNKARSAPPAPRPAHRACSLWSSSARASRR